MTEEQAKVRKVTEHVHRLILTVTYPGKLTVTATFVSSTPFSGIPAKGERIMIGNIPGFEGGVSSDDRSG
jgi:hypothetical protein